ncbi:MAG: helicase, partial [Anaerolineae bacterium]|nr:helicase [Anaerolineae bacterium]
MTLNLPYVIDNRAHKLADILNDLLASDPIHALDIATAYFNVGAFELVQAGLEGLASFRLLLGAEPGSAAEVGLRPRMRGDLDAAPYTEAMQRLVEALIRFLRRESVTVRLYQRGFLHAKSYLFFADTTAGDRFIPVTGIVGSSNFTRPGLTTNQELNLTHKAIIDVGEADDVEAQVAIEPLLALPKPRDAAAALPLFEIPTPSALPDVETRRAIKSEVGSRAILDLVDWYDARWDEARDFKAELVDLLNTSKFGAHEYTPYQIYLKTLYEYFKDELDEDTGLPGTRSAVELTEFQDDAVKKARRILARYDGVMIADSVGLGKTWIGKKLLEDTAYHRRQKALVVCPAALREMWRGELREATIPAEILSQELLGREDFETGPYHDVDIILIDEAHNFRNPTTHRYQNLEDLIAGNGGNGRDGARKKLILLTATPINNTIFDLYNQILLFTQGDQGYFTSVGIGDLHHFFINARRAMATDGAPPASETAALFNLLEEVVVRRTRPFIRMAYPEATIHGHPIHWPERKLRTVRYNLEAAYAGIYAEIVEGIESLTLAHYNLEAYKRTDLARDAWELGREQALVGIFKSRFLKRFESSVAAFRISTRRALEFLQTFAALLETGKLLNSAEFRKAMRYLE